jgi:microcystin-dependent protein
MNTRVIKKKLQVLLMALVIVSASGFLFPLAASAGDQPFLGEIDMFAGNFAPDGWMFCDGQTLPISQYDTLFNLIGTTYGGDGQTTFKLPDLQGRVPISQGANFTLGQSGGTETTTLSTANLPTGFNLLDATASPGNTDTPGPNTVMAQTQTANGQPVKFYTASSNTRLHASNGGSSGLPISIQSPYLGISYIISLYGIYPSQN